MRYPTISLQFWPRTVWQTTADARNAVVAEKLVLAALDFSRLTANIVLLTFQIRPIGLRR